MNETPKPALHIGKPAWLKTDIPRGQAFFKVKENLREKSLVTVCEEAKCPNISECWNSLTATFMVLGDTCTRACRFCHIKTGSPGGWLDVDEPAKIARSCAEMKLNYVVITMVNRDDLEDGGSSHLAKVIHAVRAENPGIRVEILAGDFRGRQESLLTLLSARPEVYAHNLETVASLSSRVRDARASYELSLSCLSQAKKLADYPVLTKSALMLGLGESIDEVQAALRDLREQDVDFVTIGQYMRPTKRHLPIRRWVHPDEFTELGNFARELGFKAVASSPLVRSSYKARQFYESAVR